LRGFSAGTVEKVSAASLRGLADGNSLSPQGGERDEAAEPLRSEGREERLSFASHRHIDRCRHIRVENDFQREFARRL
jgi:hypothetical protein